MAQLHKQRYPMPEWREGVDWRAHHDAQDAALTALRAKMATLPEGSVKDAVISFPVADGFAWYRVTSEKPLTLQFIPFCDDYQINPAMLRGLRLADVRGLVERERRLQAFFAQRAAEAK